MTNAGAFWEDLARDLDDPEFEREYVTASAQIAEVDAVLNAEAAAAYDAILSDPSRGMSANALRERLAQRRRPWR